MTQEDAEGLIRTLFAMYPRARMPQMTIDVYCSSILRYDPAPLSRTLGALAEESEYLPSLAAIHGRMRETSDHRPGESFERALATAPDRRCGLCGGSGWVDSPMVHNGRKIEAVRPCSCRGGYPVTPGVLDREAVSEEMSTAMTEFEVATGEPLFAPALDLLARDLAGPFPDMAVDRLRKAVRFAKARNVAELVGGAIERVNE